jgi:hypothetical protein
MALDHFDDPMSRQQLFLVRPMEVTPQFHELPRVDAEDSNVLARLHQTQHGLGVVARQAIGAVTAHVTVAVAVHF